MPSPDQPVDHGHLVRWTNEELADAWQQLAGYPGDDSYLVLARDAVAREREFRRVLPHLPGRPNG